MVKEPVCLLDMQVFSYLLNIWEFPCYNLKIWQTVKYIYFKK